ncbi:MAG: twin-arginine translocation signal domain-containing protein [Faecalibacterium sp.]
MKEKISRRSFLQVLGLGLGAAVLTACTPGAADSPVNSPAGVRPRPGHHP